MRYLDFESLTISQENVMKIVEDWVHTEKTPVPHSEILIRMKKKGEGEGTIKDAINSLLKKCYLRRAVTISSGHRSFYVQLRRV